ncbi:MAG TPA: SEC-C domain-containing protein [Planctomycetota bacterium]|jgi:preprotein translocase subunit SecA|nr:SEC-C domain-containing protein [Planctomycetota bacterium]
MASQRIALDLAAWMDSSHAGRIPGLDKRQERQALERFLQAAYDDLGKAPHLLDGQELHELLGHVLPGRFSRKDAAIAHVPELVRRYLAHLEEVETVANSFELQQALDATGDEFVEAARSGRVAQHGAPPTAPIVNRAPKLGRNDPCWCGSGKKFKKCHGAPGAG